MRHLEGFRDHDTKTGESGFREIPIPESVTNELAELVAGRGPRCFVFSTTGRTPIGANVPTRALHRALALVGVSEDDQRQRCIDFHSWRHFYNSVMRGAVSDADLRNVTGHSSVSMTDRYSHRVPERFGMYALAQNQIFSKLTVGNSPDVSEASLTEDASSTS